MQAADRVVRPHPNFAVPQPRRAAQGPRAHTEGPRLPPHLLRGRNHTAAFPGGRGRPPSGPRAWAAVHTSACATWATRRSAEANATFEGASARLCENMVQIGRCRSLVETSAAQDECVPERRASGDSGGKCLTRCHAPRGSKGKGRLPPRVQDARPDEACAPVRYEPRQGSKGKGASSERERTKARGSQTGR